MLRKEGRELPSIPVQGNSHVIGAVFTGLCAVPAQPSFSIYLDALTELVPWFFALDHTNYTRLFPINLRDITELPRDTQMLPDNLMLAISRFRRPTGVSRQKPIDQAHEQNNACIKSDVVPSCGGW